MLRVRYFNGAGPLQAMLHAVYMITLCRTSTVATYPAFNPVDAMVGQMDWHWDLHLLLEGAGICLLQKTIEEVKIKMNEKETAEAQELIDKVKNGTGPLTPAKPVFPNPNNMQVGGQHYHTADASYQHWDYVADYGLCYFTGNLTKYVMRWQQKGGVTDLEKAMHYLDKLVQLYDDGLRSWTARQVCTLGPHFTDFCTTQQLGPLEIGILRLAATYVERGDLMRLHRQLEMLLAQGRVVGYGR